MVEQVLLRVVVKLLLGIAAGVAIIGSYLITQDKSKLDQGLNVMNDFIVQAEEASQEIAKGANNGN